MLMSDEQLEEWRKHYPFKSHYLEIDGHNYHYLDEGEGEVILCLHGNPTWSFYYRNLIEYYSKNYRVIAPDHLGCGLSDKPQSYSYRLNDHIDNALYLIHQLELKNITLVVHDWGGAIGMGVATMAPSLFKRIVLLNTAAFTSSHIPWQISLCRLPWLGEWMVRKLNAFAWPATWMSTVRPLAHDIKQGYLFPYRSYANRVAIARFVQDIPMSEEHPTYSTLKSIENRLPDITVPKLILWGGKDFCFTEKHFYRHWKSLYPEARGVVFKEAGHYVLEDSSEEIFKEMDQFFKEHP